MNEMIFFGGLAALISICSIMVVSLSNPVSAAVFLVVDLFLLGAVYAFQGADFVAAIQIIVYTGAILVLFLFVIMILNLDPKTLVAEQQWRFGEKFMLTTVVGTFTFLVMKFLPTEHAADQLSTHTLADNTKDVAMRLFQNYVWPFEIVSMLILLAIVGAISIAGKNKEKGI
jgi:NADH-quinone oxidoreductase subunit J